MTASKAVVDALLAGGGIDEGGQRTAFTCWSCGGRAVLSGRSGKWRCWGDCGIEGDAGDLAGRLGIGRADGTLARLGSALGATPNGTAGTTMAPTTIDAAALAIKAFPEPRYAVPGVLPEGGTLLVGAPKKGKSWLVLGWSVEIAAGGFALASIPVEQGDVLYLALEDNERRLQDRLGSVLQGRPAPARLHIATQWPGLADGGAAHVDAWLAAHPDARLVVVDVLARMRRPVSGAANLYQADYQAMAEMKSIADARGVALVGVHHTRKAAADDPLDTISGTTGLAGAADTILVLQRERGRADATLYVRGRDVPEAEHALAFDAESCTWRLLGDAAEYRLTEERAAIVDALRAVDEPLTPKQIAEAISKKDGAVRFLIRKMAQAGEVVGNAGRYSAPVAQTANSANSANSAHPANSPNSRPVAAVGVSTPKTTANPPTPLFPRNGAGSPAELAELARLAGGPANDGWTH